MADDASQPKPGSVCAALQAAGHLDVQAARSVQERARAQRVSPVDVIHRSALVSDETVLDCLRAATGLPVVGADAFPAAPIELSAIRPGFLRKCHTLPLGWRSGALIVAVADPFDDQALATIAFSANAPLDLRLASVSGLKRAFDALYGNDDQDTATEIAPPLEAASFRAAEDSPAIRIVEAVIDQALERGASDLHFEPLVDRLRVRARIDGELITIREEQMALAAPIAARLKVMADMDVADRRRPQDGRTTIAAKGAAIDVRVSSVPTVHGETVALRILRRDPSLLDFEALGFSPEIQTLLTSVLRLRRGLFLIAGPTGSGKTTTLYAMIERLRSQSLKIHSIEDPIEYFFPDVAQTQVNEDAGVTFASALRSFLRQDPDVILVGEIRDIETARIAIQAALTGHLVLATVHTQDAAGAMTRLIDMGVDRFLLAATLIGVASQRLVRRLCSACRHPRAPERGELAGVAAHDLERIFEPVGCGICRGSGYVGRLAVAEGFSVSPRLRAALSSGDQMQLEQELAAQGFTPLMKNAERLMGDGLAAPLDIRALGLI